MISHVSCKEELLLKLSGMQSQLEEFESVLENAYSNMRANLYSENFDFLEGIEEKINKVEQFADSKETGIAINEDIEIRQQGRAFKLELEYIGR